MACIAMISSQMSGEIGRMVGRGGIPRGGIRISGVETGLSAPQKFPPNPKAHPQPLPGHTPFQSRMPQEPIMGSEIAIRASEWEKLALEHPSAKWDKLRVLVEKGDLGPDSWRMVGLTAAEKAAWASTTLFDEFLMSRLVDCLISDYEKINKSQVSAVKLLMAWKVMGRQDRAREESIEAE